MDDQIEASSESPVPTAGGGEFYSPSSNAMNAASSSTSYLDSDRTPGGHEAEEGSCGGDSSEEYQPRPSPVKDSLCLAGSSSSSSSSISDHQRKERSKERDEAKERAKQEKKATKRLLKELAVCKTILEEMEVIRGMKWKAFLSVVYNVLFCALFHVASRRLVAIFAAGKHQTVSDVS